MVEFGGQTCGNYTQHAPRSHDRVISERPKARVAVSRLRSCFARRLHEEYFLGHFEQTVYSSSRPTPVQHKSRLPSLPPTSSPPSLSPSLHDVIFLLSGVNKCRRNPPANVSWTPSEARLREPRAEGIRPHVGQALMSTASASAASTGRMRWAQEKPHAPSPPDTQQTPHERSHSWRRDPPSPPMSTRLFRL